MLGIEPLGKRLGMEKSKLRELIERGTNVAGTATGAALTMITGSPEVGVALTAIGATGIYQKVGGEIADRWLAPREAARVGSVMARSVEMLKSELEEGKTLRQDGFFDDRAGRSDAEEVMEGVLRKAQAEYEERKLEYLARMWASACLDENLTTARLNYMVKLAEQLTYRQLTIIAMIGAMAKAKYANIFGLREQHYEKSGLIQTAETSIILSEIMVLHNRNCLAVIAPLGPVQIDPSRMKLDTWGVALYNAMGLWKIPPSEYQPIIEYLK